MPQILFATNRQKLPVSTPDLAKFGDAPMPPAPDNLFCGIATVANIDIGQPAAGIVQTTSPLVQGSFAADQLAPLLRSTNDVLIFIHGAANSFEDAMTRAAYNKAWIAAANLGGVNCDFDLIAFSWPARSYCFADLVGDYFDYREDQAAAGQSYYHADLFLRQMYALRQRIGNRRLNLLCHSMGNYVLAGAVEQWFAGAAAPTQPLFDEIILAAADEDAATFAAPNGRRLSHLWRLGREITVYSNRDDVAMALSHVANFDYRLGYDGPANAADTGFFSRNVYEFVNCSGVNDYLSNILVEPDRSHQYYRQSPTVRADIAASLAGLTPNRLRYDASANVYSLFA